jgi:triphosphoribosyl-dephospho-CoA synthase
MYAIAEHQATQTHALADWSQFIAELGYKAMLIEVYTTPKPGLVDRRNTGSHTDMTVETFERSAEVIAPWLARFVELGAATVAESPAQVFQQLRQLGQGCEQDMFAATQNINTHKGMLFSLALICAAAGRLWSRKAHITAKDLCLQVASLTRGIVQRELHQNRTPVTAGERFYQQYQITGVRGEVESGFATIRDVALPAYRKAVDFGADRNTALLEVMLVLLAHNQDTNLIHRGGLAGLQFAQQQAQQIITTTEALSDSRRQALIALDDAFIAQHLSPGGSADLLALTWLLAQFPRH